MKSQLAAILLTCLFAGATPVLAAEAGSYKPDTGSDQPTQTSGTAKRDAKRRYAPHEITENSVPPASGCINESSFDAMGDNNSAFDPQIGCSTQANLSGMVENPGDLFKGRGTRYSDGERASEVVRQYRSWKGSSPASQGSSKTTSAQ